MADHIYIIKKFNFDYMENHSPVYTQIIGYRETLQEANRFVTAIEQVTTKRKEYDGKYYPYFKMIKVSKI